MSVVYQPQYRLHGTTTWTNWGSPISGTSVVVGNSTTPLTSATQYDFQVVASDTFGSTPSNTVTSTTLTAVTITSIVLSGSKAFTTGTTDAVVGTIAVTMSSGAFSGTLSLSGADALSFKIVNVSGTNTLETNGALSTAKTYSVSIVATQNGVANSPFTSAAQSIVGSAPVNTTLTAPAIASNAGFNTLSFNDDFNVAGTIATSRGATSGFKWYWSLGVDTFGGAWPHILDGNNSWSVNTTQTAANVSPTNNAGPNASSAGGILTLLPHYFSNTEGVSFVNSVLATVPVVGGMTSVPSFGNWKHCYFEAYIRYTPSLPNSAHTSDWGFPAFWCWGVEGTNSFGGTGTLNAAATEIDFLEDYTGVTFNGNLNTPINVGHVVNPGGNGVFGVQAQYPTSNAEWHTFGCLWTNANQVSFFKDGVQAGSTVDCSGIALANSHQFMLLSTIAASSTEVGDTMHVDWVRVWTA